MPIPSLSPLKENILPESKTLPMRGVTPMPYQDNSTLGNPSVYPSYLPPPAKGGIAKTVTAEQLYNARKFGIYDPEKSESEFAYGQTWGEKMVNGVGKGLLLTGTTFLQTTVGAVNGLAQWGKTGKAASFYNNDLNKWVDDVNAEAENRLPNLYTDIEKNADWYSPKYAFTANFLWDGIIKNLGFSAGAALSGMAFAGALRAIPIASKLFSVGKAAETLAVSEEAIATAGTAEKAAETYGKIKSLSDKFINQYNLLNPGGRALIAGLSTSGEASFEAYQNLNQFRKQRIQEYKDTHEGQEPMGIALDNINKEADNVGNSSYLMNVALLSATNYIQFPKILGSSYKAEKGMINSLTRETGEIIEEGGKYIAKPAVGGRFLSTINKIRPFLFSSSEAFEEGAQYAIQVGTEDYYNKKYKNEPAEVVESLFEGIKQTVGTNEGMKNILIGGLSGALMLGRGKLKESREITENTAAAVQQFNKYRLSDFTTETLESVNRGVSLQEEREQALKSGDILNSKDKEADYIINYLSPRIKYGRFDLVKAEIDNYRTLASTEEGFSQLQAEGKALQTDTREDYLNRLNNLESTANNVKSLYQSLNLRYGSAIDENGKILYSPAVMDKLVYAATKVADYDKRLIDLSGSLAATGIDLDKIASEVINKEAEAFNKAITDIKAIANLNDDQKQDLAEALEDFSELSIRRNKLLTEYNDIKANPKKYQEQKVESVPTGETITVKTKTGEKEVVLGEEYYLGSIPYKDESGVEKRRYPRLKILGENPDGTIKIQDASGQIRDITKSELEDYRLAKVSEVDKSENSRFYFRNIIKNPNTIVYWNTGKDKAGKIPGHLRYDNATDKLYFVYDIKGKQKIREIGIDQFSPKEGYKEGLYTFGRELTEEDTKDISTRQTSGKTEKDIQARRGDKLRVLNALYQGILDNSEKVDKLLAQKRIELDNISKELLDIEEKVLSDEGSVDKRYKKLTFKPAIRKAIEAANRLSKMKDDLTKEIAALEDQKATLDVEKEDLIPYIQDIAQNIDELPIGNSDFLKELKEQKSQLEDVILATSVEIETSQNILNKVQDALDSAIEYLSDLIKKFKRKYKGAPTNISPEWTGRQTAPDTFSVALVVNSQWADFLEANPNFLEKKPDYKDDLRQLEDLVAQVEDLDIVPGERQIKELNEAISALQEELKNSQSQLGAINKIIDRFEEIAKQNKERQEQEQVIKNNQALQKQLLGTHTKDVQNVVSNAPYSPAKKKDALQVVTSTIASSDFTKPHQLRANRFGFRLPKLKKTFKGIIVTSKTEDQIIPGLTDFLLSDLSPEQKAKYKKEEIIALLVTDENGSPIDENGNVITEDLLNNAIFQTFPLEKLSAFYEGKEESMFRDGTDPNVEASLREQYAQWRKQQLEQTTLPQPQGIDASFGTPQLVTYKDEKGIEKIDYDARTSVSEAGISTEEDLENKQLVKVATSNESVNEGSVTFNTPLGRVFIRIPGKGLVKLQNRKFNEKEANTIFDVIQQVCKNTYAQLDTNISQEERINLADENKDLYNWLRSVVYWGTPKNEAGYSSIWFEGNTLHISGKGATFEFTPSTIAANKNQIITLIQGMYNNTNATLVNSKWNTPYFEITGIDENGKATTKAWPNYQTYLLSSEGRKTEDIPLTTNLKPLSGEEDTNRKGIYFTLQGQEYTISKEVPKKPKEEPKTPEKPVEEAKQAEGFVLDGTTVNTLPVGEFGQIHFTFDGSKGEKGWAIVPDDDIKNAIQALMDKRGYDEQKAKSIIVLSLLNKVKPQLEAIAVPKESPIVETTEEDDEEWNGANDNEPKDSEYREQLVKEANQFEEEEWPKVEQWLKANFPHLPIYRVKRMIQAVNGRQAWGMLHNGAIYLYEHAEGGTAYHEVFEAVWKMMATNEEKENIAKEFRNRKGTYVDRFTGETIEYANATDKQLKEELAEEFRDYMLYKKSPIREQRSWIKRMFDDIINIFKEFFTGEKALNNTEQLFKNISIGYYKDFIPYKSKLAFANVGFTDIDNAYADDSSDMRLENIPAQQLNDVIQHMTYSTLVELIETDKSLFEISDIKGEKKKALYDRLYNEIFNKIRYKGRQFEEALAKKEISSETASREIGKLKGLWKSVKSQWTDVVAKHQEQLLSYGVQFDENDNLVLTDEDNSGKSDYQDARKVDQFRKANSAVKILLATLPATENGKLKKSSIGGVVILPQDKVFITLKNRLYNSEGIEDMFSKLENLALNNPDYVRLYRRLTKTEPSKSVNFSKLDREGLHLVSAFWKAMKAQNPDVLSVFVLSNGEVVIGDSSLASASKQAKREMLNNMVEEIKTRSPYFKYDEKKGIYSPTAILNNYVLNAGKIDTYIAFLKGVGIEFTENDLNKLNSFQLEQFKKAVEGLKLSLMESKDIKVISTKTLDIEGVLTKLGATRAIIENPEFSSTYFNINGERVQTFLGVNIISNLHDAISKVTNKYELKGTNHSYLLDDVFSQDSVVLNKIFNPKSGEKRDGTEDILYPVLIDGTINEQTGKKKESSKLSHKERVVQEMNMNSVGVFMNLVPGDASMEHAVRLHTEDSPFVTEEMLKNGTHQEIFKNYFISEINLARDNRRVVGKTEKERKEKQKSLRFFKAILGEELHKEIMSKENSLFSPEDIYNEYQTKIKKAVDDFINNEAEDTNKLLRAYGVIEQTKEGLVANGLYFSHEELTDKIIENKLRTLSVNYIIANIELHKLVYSDPYQYSDELKRIKNFNSPRQPLVYGSASINEALNTKYNEGYEKGDIGYTDMNQEHFRTVTLSDVFSNDELSGYDSPYEETDGGGYISLKAKRIMKIRSGEWTEDNERQYRYDVAYEKVIKGIELTEEEKKFDIHQDKNDKYVGKNPHIKDTYTPEKPIVSGNKDNGREYNDIILDKFALVPISFRILHELNPEPNALKLYDKMQIENIDYGVYGTGRKVGAEVLSPLYNEKGEFDNTPFETDKQKKSQNTPQSIINIPFSIIGVQTEVPSKDKPLVTQGSQITKLATMDFMEAGVPIDFNKGQNFDDRFSQWTLLSEEQKLSYNDGKNLYKEIKHNQEILEERIKEGYNSLLNKLGIKETDEGYEISDVDRMIDTLSSEILKREVNDNITDAFEGFKKGDVVLEATPAYQQIRNILYSIADKNIMSPKISGGMKVQIPSTLLESNRIESKVVNGKQTYTSDVLKFYRNKDGERVCEIMVGRWFDSKLSDEELLNYLNNTEEGQKILGGIGFRIPTQKQNSIDVFKIAKFLPKDFGDSVVIPSALVKKAGSDFDIDKLSVYLKNTFEDASKKLHIVELKGTKEATKEFYKNEYTEKLRNKLEKIANKDEFRISVFNILDKFETVEDTKSILDFFPNLTEEETEFYLNYREVFEAIRNKADEQNLLPSEYQKRVLDEANNNSAKWMMKLIDAELTDAYGDKMYKEALENEYIQSLQNLISSPENFDALVKPNSAEELKDLTKDINQKLGIPEVDYSNVGNMLNRRFMTTLRNNFVTGKYAIGIAAVNQTNHAQNQRGVITIDNTLLDRVSEEDRKWLGDAKIKFREYNKIKVEGKGLLPTLSMIRNQEKSKEFPEGRVISDIVSQFIDGYVDISKGAWVMELGATPNVASTWLFLVKLGVPVKTVAYFMNQPIIKDYLRTVQNAGYSWLFIDNFVTDMNDIYSPQSQMAEETILPTEKELGEMVGKKTKELTDRQKNQQQFILDEFLKYAKMANHMFLLTQGSNYDTANFNDPYLVFKKEEQLKKARKTIVSSVDDLLDNSFIRVLRGAISNVRDAFSTVLVSDRQSNNPSQFSIRDVMEAVLTPYTELNNRDFVKVSQKAVADFFDWAVQIDRGLNTKIAEILLGNKSKRSVAQQIIALKESALKNTKHPLHNNLILNSLKIQSGEKEGRVNNLYIAGKENKVYDQNLVISAFRELKQHLGTEKGGLYGNFVRLAVLQSGLTNSPIAFTQLLPYEDFKEIYNKTLSTLENNPNLIDFFDQHIFERNNWSNSDIVPFKKESMKQNKLGNWYYPSQEFVHANLKKAMKNGEIPKVVNISRYSQEGRHDFITYSWEEYITKAERAKRRRTGDRSHVHKILAQKVYTEDENGNAVPLIHVSEYKGKTYESFVYKAMNAWGDSFRAKEFYNDNRTSVLDNGYDKIEKEVEDDVIASIFSGEKILSLPAVSVEQKTEEWEKEDNNCPVPF